MFVQMEYYSIRKKNKLLIYEYVTTYMDLRNIMWSEQG